MARQLLHIPTKTLYPWFADLAKRGDMREVVPEPAPAPKGRTKAEELFDEEAAANAAAISADASRSMP